jgi:spore maturation protein CgeB
MNHPLYAKRFETMAKLAKRYKTRFVTGVHFEDMANVYGSAKIGWHMSVTGRDLDMRVFEVMCSGRPLVCDSAEESGIAGLFDSDGIDAYDGAASNVPCWTYDDDAEMWDDLEYLLTCGPDLRAAIGAEARAAVLAAHTYRHRAHELMRTVGLE